MTLQTVAGLKIFGQSNDTKPTTLDNELWSFEERDSGRFWKWLGGKWVQDGYVEEIANKIKDGLPFIKITGDEFALNGESSLYLLEDNTSKIGGGVLTENPSAFTYADDNDRPLKGFPVTTLNGSTQYFSRATEAQFEVGTGSFMASIWFKTNTKGANQTLFQYGDRDNIWWSCVITSVNVITARFDDGTNDMTVSDTIAERWQDGKWHNAIIMLDTSLTVDTGFLFVDGEFIASSALALGTLNQADDMQIGAGRNTTVNNHFNGQLSNFHIIKAADYNAIAVLNQGIRKSVASGTLSIAASPSYRLTNNFSTASIDQEYFTTVIDIEEGEYEIQQVLQEDSAFGTSEVKIDGEVVQSIDQSTDTSVNTSFSDTGISISKGKHILEYKNNSGAAKFISTHWINLIKRKGHNNGGTDKIFLLGDELVQRRKSANATFSLSTLDVFSNEWSGSTVDGSFSEGDLFLRGGLWKFTIYYQSTTALGKYDLFFNDVKVLDQFNPHGSTLRNKTVESTKKIQQGKNTIRLAINGQDPASSQFFHRINVIIGERIGD